MTSHNGRFGIPLPCLRCLRHEIRQVNKAIARAEAAPAGGAGSRPPADLPVIWDSIECGFTNIRCRRCDLCDAVDDICPRVPALIYGNTHDMVATICYIIDILAIRNPSNSAVVEEGDEVAHIFPRATRAGVIKALAKLGAAFDVMVTRHQREHKLLGSHKREIMRPREHIYQDKVDARRQEMIQSGALNGPLDSAMRLQPGDTCFLDWNTAVQDFRSEVTRVMEDTDMAQGAIDLVVSNLPI